VEEEAPRRRGRRGRRARAEHPESGHGTAAHDDRHDDGLDEDSLVHAKAHGATTPYKPYAPRTGRTRRRRSPVAVIVSLLVLAGLVVGIVIGGQKLIQLIDPTAQDSTGQGT